MDEKAALCTLATANRLADSAAQLPQSAAKAFDTKTVFEQLSCPVCKDLYVAPVLLSCGHMICAECWNGDGGGHRAHLVLRQCYVCRQPVRQEAVVTCQIVDTLVATLFPSEAATRLRDKVRDTLCRQELAKLREEAQQQTRLQVQQEFEQAAHRADAVAPAHTLRTDHGGVIALPLLPDDGDGLEPPLHPPVARIGVAIPTRRRRPVGWATRALVWTLERLEWLVLGPFYIAHAGVWAELRGGYEDGPSLYRAAVRVLADAMRSVAMFNWLALGILSPAIVGFVLWRIYSVTK